MCDDPQHKSCFEYGRNATTALKLCIHQESSLNIGTPKTQQEHDFIGVHDMVTSEMIIHNNDGRLSSHPVSQVLTRLSEAFQLLCLNIEVRRAVTSSASSSTRAQPSIVGQ